EGAAEDLLRRGVRVDVRGVEGRDAHVEGGAHAGDGGVLLDLGGVRQPVAEGDLGDFQAGTAEESMLHDPRLGRPGDRLRPATAPARPAAWAGGTGASGRTAWCRTSGCRGGSPRRRTWRSTSC